MKISKRFFIGLIALFFISGLQAATISSEKGVEILALNGKELESGRYVNDKKLNVDAGKHQLVIRYYGNVRKGSKNAIYSTPPYVFSVDLKQDDHIVIQAPRLHSYSQAQAYFRRGAAWKVIDQHGTEKLVQYEELTGKGLMPFADVEKAVTAYNRKHGRQELLPAEQSIATQKLSATGQNDTLIQTIQLLYNNATPEQKALIKNWIKKQP